MACDLSALANLDPTDAEATQQLLTQCTAALTDPTLWIWAIVFTVVCALVGGWIGKYKNAVARDALLGAAFGPIGWVISLLLPARKLPSKCRACGHTVDAGDRHCRHCGAALAAARAGAGGRA
jgi:hypothetical protein